MKKFFLVVSLFSTLVSLTGGIYSVHAVPTSLKQQILPLDCVFQVVNDGSNTVVYLTPAQCGQIIDVPPNPGTGGGGETEDPTPLPTVFTRVETGNGTVEFPFLPGVASPSSRLSDALGNAPYLPYAPLSSVQDASEEKKAETVPFDLKSVPAPVVAISLITLVLIILLFFL